MCNPVRVSYILLTGETRAYQLGSPLEIALAHQPAYTLIPGGIGDEEHAIANMATTAGVIGPDIKTAQANFSPVRPSSVHELRLIGTPNIAQEHDSSEVGKPEPAEMVQ